MISSNILIILKFSDYQLKLKLEYRARMPTRATFSSAGLDLYTNEQGVVQIGERHLVSTGIRCEFPPKTYGRIAARSGLSLKGIDIGAGVIDADYTGVIQILIINNGTENFIYERGDRIAQLIIEEYRPVTPYLANISSTDRETSGFGSTGK